MEADGFSVTGVRGPQGTADYVPPTQPRPDTKASRSKAQAPADPPLRGEAVQAAESLGKALNWLDHGIRYEIDAATHTVITKIVDNRTDEVVRQIPSEEVVELTRRLRKYIGVLLDIAV